jgi:putative hemolysin
MDKYLFSYATASDPPIKRGLIRLVEKATGQPTLKRMYVHNQRFPRSGEDFWQAAVRSLELDVRYDARALAAVPKTGPVVFVANHPYGVLDGIVMAWLVSKARPDFLVLTHIVLTRAPEAAPFILPIDFSGAEGAEQTNLASRAAARAHLAKGGAVVVFPAGAISTTPDKFGSGPAVDGRWQPFVSQLIQRSKASVMPIWFGGQNSRLFQIASHVSLTLRLSLRSRRASGPLSPLRSGRRFRSHPSLLSKTDRSWQTNCAPASMAWRGLLRRSPTNRDGRSASCCGQSYPHLERTARRKPRRSPHAALSISARRAKCSLIMPRASFATLVSSRLSGDFR